MPRRRRRLAGALPRRPARRLGPQPHPQALLGLVSRCADRLRAELALPGREAGLRVGVEDADLLDLLLTLEVPVADPDPKQKSHRHNQLNLRDWARADQRRELLAIAADPRFHPAFRRALNALGDAGADIIQRVAGSAGGRPLLTEWVRDVARDSTAAGLPGVPQAIARLSWLPAEALGLAPGEVAAAAAADLAETLARTLRGGLFEELTWPSWESAVAELGPGQGHHGLTLVEAWPYLIVANHSQVRVIDADSTVLTHDLRVPAGNSYRHSFQYVDGELLVFWSSYNNSQVIQGYWHHSPGTVLTLDGDRRHWELRSEHITLLLSGGGRATGGGVLHRGDTALPDELELLSDGASYWLWQRRDHENDGGWREYDPATSTRGRYSRPAFLTDATRGLPSTAVLSERASWLRPAPDVPGSVLGTPADGLLGWATVRLPGHGWHGHDTAGRTVTVPEGHDMPVAALTFPGDERPRGLSMRWRELSIIDPDGVVTARSRDDLHRNGNFATGSVDLPPLTHWYALSPRDPEGSAALRAADRDTVAALLKAAAAADRVTDLPGLVSAALPQVTDPKLIGGIVEVLRFTLAQQKSLDAVAARLHPDANPRHDVESGPTDILLGDALNGLIGTGYYRWGGDCDAAHRFLRELADAGAHTDATAAPGRLHWDMPALRHSAITWTPWLDQPAALAYRAAGLCVTDEQRAGLLTLLDAVDALGLDSAQGSADRWRRVLLHLDQRHLRTPDGIDRGLHHRSLLPLGGGAVLALTEHAESVPDGHEFGALLHDPTGGFTVPGPYTVRGEAPLGDRERGAGWLRAFLTAAAEHGPAPFLPEAAEEFARLTGVSGTLARLVVAGLPRMDDRQHHFLPAPLRTTLGVKSAEAGHARDELIGLDAEVRRAVVGALLPADPARLWSDGPDVAAAAQVWNRRVGRRTPVPDWLLTEAVRAVRTGWSVHRALPALLDPAAAPELSVDVPWTVKGDRAEPREPAARPFTAQVLTGALSMAAWLAHRLPAGDPVRAALPPALTAVRQRLAAPELLLLIGYFTDLAEFRKAAGTPTETAEAAGATAGGHGSDGYERYGAVILPTHDGRPMPVLRPTLLDSTGRDPYLPLLRGADQTPNGIETALRLAHDPAFAALLADPGAPAAGTAAADGTWWPQDPSRSVPELVAEAAGAHGLGADAAALYLMLLAMPDPTDRNTARWTGWKPARLKAARAELAATDLVVPASRSRAGRSLFLPGGWSEMSSPTLPVEQWKLSMYGPRAGARWCPSNRWRTSTAGPGSGSARATGRASRNSRSSAPAHGAADAAEPRTASSRCGAPLAGRAAPGAPHVARAGHHARPSFVPSFVPSSVASFLRCFLPFKDPDDPHRTARRGGSRPPGAPGRGAVRRRTRLPRRPGLGPPAARLGPDPARRRHLRLRQRRNGARPAGRRRQTGHRPQVRRRTRPGRTLRGHPRRRARAPAHRRARHREVHAVRAAGRRRLRNQRPHRPGHGRHHGGRLPLRLELRAAAGPGAERRSPRRLAGALRDADRAGRARRGDHPLPARGAGRARLDPVRPAGQRARTDLHRGRGGQRGPRLHGHRHRQPARPRRQRDVRGSEAALQLRDRRTDRRRGRGGRADPPPGRRGRPAGRCALRGGRCRTRRARHRVPGPAGRALGRRVGRRTARYGHVHRRSRAGRGLAGDLRGVPAGRGRARPAAGAPAGRGPQGRSRRPRPPPRILGRPRPPPGRGRLGDVAPPVGPAREPALTADPRAALDALASSRTPYLLGVRHHSPALAAVVPALLDASGADVVCVELPADFQPWLRHLADPETQSPIALAGTSGDGRLAFYPFADFSPELAAIRWAATHGATVLCCDLPLSSAARIPGTPAERGTPSGSRTPAPGPDRDVDRAGSPDPETAVLDLPVPKQAPAASGPGTGSAPQPGASPDGNVPSRARVGSGTEPARGGSFADGLAAAGTGRDGEDLWDRAVEVLAPGCAPEAVRRAALGVGWALRADTADVPATDLAREAHMREVIADALAAGHRVAAVIGAFHAPALLTVPTATGPTAAVLGRVPTATESGPAATPLGVVPAAAGTASAAQLPGGVPADTESGFAACLPGGAHADAGSGCTATVPGEASAAIESGSAVTVPGGARAEAVAAAAAGAGEGAPAGTARGAGSALEGQPGVGSADLGTGRAAAAGVPGHGDGAEPAAGVGGVPAGRGPRGFRRRGDGPPGCRRGGGTRAAGRRGAGRRRGGGRRGGRHLSRALLLRPARLPLRVPRRHPGSALAAGRPGGRRGPGPPPGGRLTRGYPALPGAAPRRAHRRYRRGRRDPAARL